VTETPENVKRHQGKRRRSNGGEGGNTAGEKTGPLGLLRLNTEKKKEKRDKGTTENGNKTGQVRASQTSSRNARGEEKRLWWKEVKGRLRTNKTKR